MKDRNPPGEDNPAAQVEVQWGWWRGEGSKEADRAKFRPQGVCPELSAQRAHCCGAKGWERMARNTGSAPRSVRTFLTTGSLTTSVSLHLAKTPFHQLKMQMVMMSVKYLVQRGNHRTGSAKLKGQAPRNARLWARQLTLRQPFLLPTAMSCDSWCFAEMKSQLAMGIWLHLWDAAFLRCWVARMTQGFPHFSV